MLMSDLNVCETAKVVQINSNSSLKRRLYDLGFFPNSRVECVLVSPFSSPILYKVNGAFIALRKKDAKEIEVAYEA